MEWTQYIILGFIFASLFFLGAAAVLYWAHKSGQLSNLEDGATSIFDEEEPLGENVDSFPEKKKKRKKARAVRTSNDPSPADPSSGTKQS